MAAYEGLLINIPTDATDPASEKRGQGEDQITTVLPAQAKDELNSREENPYVGIPEWEQRQDVGTKSLATNKLSLRPQGIVASGSHAQQRHGSTSQADPVDSGLKIDHLPQSTSSAERESQLEEALAALKLSKDWQAHIQNRVKHFTDGLARQMGIITRLQHRIIGLEKLVQKSKGRTGKVAMQHRKENQATIAQLEEEMARGLAEMRMHVNLHDRDSEWEPKPQGAEGRYKKYGDKYVTIKGWLRMKGINFDHFAEEILRPTYETEDEEEWAWRSHCPPGFIADWVASTPPSTPVNLRDLQKRCDCDLDTETSQFRPPVSFEPAASGLDREAREFHESPEDPETVARSDLLRFYCTSEVIIGIAACDFRWQLSEGRR